MKKLFITLGRERDLIRYSEKSDLKDAKEISEEQARKFIQGVKNNLGGSGNKNGRKKI